MVVCVCLAVNEERIREAVRTGATVDDVKRELGVASICGRCHECVHQVVQETRTPVAS